jgi:hypothetical protein
MVKGRRTWEEDPREAGTGAGEDMLDPELDDAAW